MVKRAELRINGEEKAEKGLGKGAYEENSEGRRDESVCVYEENETHESEID